MQGGATNIVVPLLSRSFGVSEDLACLMAVDITASCLTITGTGCFDEVKRRCLTGPSCGAAAALRADPSGSWGAPNCPALHPQLPVAQHRLAHGPAGESSHRSEPSILYDSVSNFQSRVGRR